LHTQDSAPTTTSLLSRRFARIGGDLDQRSAAALKPLIEQKKGHPKIA
jgi:hypothetical protein